MIVEMIGAAIVGGFMGVLTARMAAAREVLKARAEGAKWKGEFNRVVKDLAKALAERDEARQHRDQAMGTIRHMQPLFDLGARRQAAIDKANAAKKSKGRVEA